MKSVYKPEAAHQRYVLKDGTEVIGASSIAKVDDETANRMAAWGNKLGRQGINSNKYRDQAADAGNVAHFLIQSHFQRKVPDFKKMSEEAIEIGHAVFSRFMDWWTDEELTWIASELELLSETYRYGGTIDLIACDRKDRILIMDLKTSTGVFFSHRCQIAGLGQLWNENNETPYYKLMIIHIPRSMGIDIDIVTMPNPEQLWNTFLSQLNFINNKKLAGGYKD